MKHTNIQTSIMRLKIRNVLLSKNSEVVQYIIDMWLGKCQQICDVVYVYFELVIVKGRKITWKI